MELRHVVQDAEAARHIAVERRIAHRHFALIACIEQEIAELIRKGHQDHPPDARLEIFFSDIERTPVEHRLQEIEIRLKNRIDRDEPGIRCPRFLASCFCIGDASRRGIAGGKPYAKTFSAPRASLAMQATRAESIPPESPNIAFLNPCFCK